MIPPGALFLVVVIWTLGVTTSIGQNEGPATQKFVDSIIRSLDTVQDNFEKVKLLTSNAGLKRYTPITKQLIEKSIEISKIVNEPRHAAHSYYSMGNYYYFNAKIDSCLSYMDKAYEYVQDIEDPMLESSILATKGGAYSKLGAVILSISTSIEAKDIMEKIDTLALDNKEQYKLKGQTLVLNNSLANLYNKIEDYDQALIYYDEAYSSAMKLGSKPNASIILNNKGNLLVKMERYEEAMTVLSEAKEKKIDAGLPDRFIAGSDLNIGMAHFAMGNYDEALNSYQKALEINQRINNKAGIMMNQIEIGSVNNAYGFAAKAEEYCEKGKQAALELDDSEYVIKACECLHKAHSSLGNYKASLENHEIYTRVKDSVFNEKNIRKFTQVGMQYEFDKKEAEQQLIIDRKNRQKNQILVGLIALGVFALTLFIFFRKRLKYQKTISKQKEILQQQKYIELQQQNKLTAMSSMIEGQEAERLRIAKDLHDSLGGLLSTVKAHFGSIQKECEDVNEVPLTKKTNDLIDEACIEVRRISHNMMPHALSISGLEGAVQDIAERLNDQNYSATVEVNNLPKLETTREVMVYRLVQEIVSNIRKHAKAKNIFIQLFGHQDEINLIVEDDGNGFDYEKAVSNGGLGLKSINSRVAFLDGTIEWDTHPGRGTNININMPVL